MSHVDRKRLGYWLSEKKSKKLSIADIEEAMRARHIEPVKIDLDMPLSSQGPFHGILHKLTDFIAQAESGNSQAQDLMRNIQQYMAQNPKMVVMDPIDCLRTLINRYKTYNIINDSILKMQETAFVPKFVALDSNDYEKNVNLLRQAGVTFPAVCKPIVAHGSTSAHQVRPFMARLMTLIFNDSGLREAVLPCVVQSFVNHNAVLYKLFALGEKYFLVERPSIKNFHDCSDYDPIHFDGGEVSKANSISQLTLQEGSDALNETIIKPCPKILSRIVREIRNTMGLGLFGIDVVVCSHTGRCAIVDVNAFPGYDGVTDFYERLADFVRHELDKSEAEQYSERFSLRNNVPVQNGEIDDKESNGGIPSPRLINRTSII